jgi:hypothetical protein
MHEEALKKIDFSLPLTDQISKLSAAEKEVMT